MAEKRLIEGVSPGNILAFNFANIFPNLRQLIMRSDFEK